MYVGVSTLACEIPIDDTDRIVFEFGLVGQMLEMTVVVAVIRLVTLILLVTVAVCTSVVAVSVKPGGVGSLNNTTSVTFAGGTSTALVAETALTKALLVSLNLR